MFVQSWKFLESHGGDKKNISIYGQERYDGVVVQDELKMWSIF
jgi:type I restriction enzyme M protein